MSCIYWYPNMSFVIPPTICCHPYLNTKSGLEGGLDLVISDLTEWVPMHLRNCSWMALAFNLIAFALSLLMLFQQTRLHFTHMHSVSSQYPAISYALITVQHVTAILGTAILSIIIILSTTYRPIFPCLVSYVLVPYLWLLLYLSNNVMSG